MGDPLEGCKAKLSRGEKHLDALDAEVRKFTAAKPYRVRAKNDAKRAERLYRVEITKRPPPEWPMLLGDCIHNLRSALDHIAWSLVELHGSAQDSTQFPIYLRQEGFRKAWQSKIGQMRRQGLKTAFDRLQPYQSRPDLYPLWILHRLDIIDKHKTLLATAMHRLPRVTLRSTSGPASVEMGPFDDGTDDVLRVHVPFGPDGPVQVDLQPFFEVEVADVEITPGDPTSLPLLSTLHDIRDVTRRAIGELGGFCD